MLCQFFINWQLLYSLLWIVVFCDWGTLLLRSYAVFRDQYVCAIERMEIVQFAGQNGIWCLRTQYWDSDNEMDMIIWSCGYDVTHLTCQSIKLRDNFGCL